MGGNALSTETPRLSQRSFIAAREHALRALRDAEPDIVCHAVRSVRSKRSHGDVDILIRQDTASRNELKWALGPASLRSNGRTDSMEASAPGVGVFQLDLTYMRPEWWRMARVYHDWNDLGNLVGKVARFRRFKYGFQGLRITVYHTMNRSQKLGEYTLTRDPERALEFLGYDPTPALSDGFDSFGEMFEYVMSSPYATYDVFQDDVCTASQRRRNKKREVYGRFSDWLDERFNPRYPGKTTPRPDRWRRRPSHREALEVARTEFSDADITSRVRADRDALSRSEAAAQVFNGRHAMDATGVTGRALGRALGALKQRYDGEDAWERHVLRSGRDALIEEFREVAGAEGLIDE